MRKIRVTFKTMLVAMVAMGLAGAASAQLNINEMAAGLAIPFLSSADGMATEIVVTNTNAADRTLHFDLINGDPADDDYCDSQSWRCTLTGRETVQISVTNDTAGGSTVTFECDAIEGVWGGLFSPNAGSKGTIDSNAENGLLWITIENDLGATVAENVLFADWTVLDVPNMAAYSAPAAGFQGTLSVGDKQYMFDGMEYSTFPDKLATNYLPPDTHPGTLLTFTLDFTQGFPPATRAKVWWYDDDEIAEDDYFEGSCFDLISYGEIAPGLGALATAGHMEIDPRTTINGPPHDPDGSRRVPLLCYNIQDAPDGGTTMRACAQSVAAFVPAQSPLFPLVVETQPNLDAR